MAGSIYERILDNIAGGRLRDGFSLSGDLESGDSESGEIGFADGAIDGIAFYHVGYADIDAAGKKQMIKDVKLCSEGKVSEADGIFAGLGKTFRALGVIDDLQHYIVKNSNRIHAWRLCRSALELILDSQDTESVKYGLSILELFKPDEQTKTAIRRLGLSDEFTLFAVWNMMQWDGGNGEIFQLAQKVSGWGKIHAVERLKPETDEIREWLLLDGINNNVMQAYSALTVWNNVDVAGKLEGQLSEEEFQGIGRIIDALLEEMAVPGISEIDRPEETLLKYLSHAKEFELDIEDYETVFALAKWAASDDVDLPAIQEECAELLSSEQCRIVIGEAVKRGEGLRLAEELGMDYAEDLFRCIAGDFEKQYRNCRYLTGFDDYLEPVMDLFREKLPLDNMRRDPTASLCIGPEYNYYDQLDAIVMELGDHPGIGEDLVAAGLWSPGIRTRNSAVFTLLDWTKAAGQPIEEISYSIFRELEDLYTKEVDPDIRERVKKLIDGIIPEDTEEEEYEEEYGDEYGDE